MPKDRISWPKLSSKQMKSRTIKALSNPVHWLLKAQELSIVVHQHERTIKRIFTRVSKNPDLAIKEHIKSTALMIAYLMTSAFMLENLTKGIVIGTNPNENTVKESTNTHDLEALFSQVGLVFINDYEKQLCERLTRFGTWAGRYPSPKLNKSADNIDTFCLFPDFNIIRKWEKELTRMLIELTRSNSSL